MNPTDPAPYLNVPLDLSEIDEAQEAAQAWAARLGYACFLVADDIASRLDQFESYWKPEDAPLLELLQQQLIYFDQQLKAAGHDV